MAVEVNLKELKELTTKIKANESNQIQAWQAVGKLLRTEIQLTFKAQGVSRFYGLPKWDMHSIYTVLMKGYRNTGILWGKGHLEGSFAIDTQARSVEVGTPRLDALYHQKGAKQKVTKKQRYYLGIVKGMWFKLGSTITLPQRKMLDTPIPEAQKLICDTYAEYLLNGIDKQKTGI